MNNSRLTEAPVSTRLSWVVRQALDEVGGNQSELAKRLGVTDTTVSKWRNGDVGSPRAENRPVIAELARQYAGKAIATSEELMGWLYPSDGGELDIERVEHLETLLGDCYASIEAARKDFEYLKLSNSEGQSMCSSLIKILKKSLKSKNLDLAKSKDYRELCKLLNADIDDVAMVRLRSLVLGQESVAAGDRMVLGAALKDLGDSTPAHELALALDCQEC